MLFVLFRWKNRLTPFLDTDTTADSKGHMKYVPLDTNLQFAGDASGDGSRIPNGPERRGLLMCYGTIYVSLFSNASCCWIKSEELT